MVKVLVLFYSTYGHVYTLAEAIAEGVRKAGAEAVLKRVPETLPLEILEKMGTVEAQKAFEHIPVVEDRYELANYDAIIFGAPTRFGLMAAQMKDFIDSLGQLWYSRAFKGKVAGVFTSSATQHGGNEFTILSFHPILLTLGFIIAGVPPLDNSGDVEEVRGITPFGASTVTGSNGERQVSQLEKEAASAQGEYIAQIAMKLFPSN